MKLILGFCQVFCQDNIECSFGRGVGLNSMRVSIKFSGVKTLLLFFVSKF
jgi:hypothetical protein